MPLEEIRLEHVPDTHRVYVGLFRGVSNAGYLQSQLLSRNSDFEYAFIDASSVISRLHLLAAVYKALTVLLDGTLKTPNVHSEVVCALSPSNNVCLLSYLSGLAPCRSVVLPADHVSSILAIRYLKHTVVGASHPPPRML